MLRYGSFIVDLQDATAQPLGLALRDLTTALISLGLALHQSWKLTLVIISTLPIIIIIVPLISRKLQPAIDRQIEALSDAAKHITNSFTVIEAVKCCNGQGVENWRYAALLKLAEKYYNRQVNWSALQTGILRAVALSMFVQGFWYGSTLIDSVGGANAAGNILTAFWSCIAATNALMQVMPLLASLEKGKVAGHRLWLLMGTKTLDTARSPTQRKIPSACKGDILFKKVQFAYPSRPQQPVLRGVSLFFGAGDLAFIIGKSGSGKSTIGQLLMQFYQPSGGKITLDNISVEDIDTHWLRSNVLLVEQTSILFNTTLQENITLGSKAYQQVSLADVIEATKFSMVRDPVEEMPQSFKTRVGSKGSGLSGGQRQRVVLARAKIRDPPVLILDESTSALDHVNRLAVMEAIRKWRKGRSTIIITHDISQILANDFVYVMKDGQVVQSGYRSAIEEVEGSPFQDLTQMLEGSSSNRCTTLNEMGLPVLPQDTVLDSDESDNGSALSRTDKLVVPIDAEEDPLDWYLDTPTNTRKSMWVTSIPNTRARAGNGESMVMSSFVTPLWSIMSSSRMTNVFGSNAFRMSNVRPRSPSVSSQRSQRTTPPAEETRVSHESLDLSQKVTKPLSVSASAWPKPVIVLPKTPIAETPMPVKQDVIPSKLESTELANGDVVFCSIKAVLATVWPNLSRWQRLRLLIGFVATLLFAASTPLFAWVFSKLLNTLYDPIDRKEKALKYSLAILGIASGDAITIFISTSNSQCLAQSWINQLRRKALSAVLEQPREFFDRDENAPSKMAECLDHHAEQMQHILGRFVGSFLTVIVMVTIAFSWSLVSCWKLTLVLLAITPILLLVTRGLSIFGAIMEKRKQDAIENANTIFAETFTSIKAVRTLTLESYFKRKHTIASDAVTNEGIKEGIYVGVFYGLSQSIIFYVIALILHYASVLLCQKDYNLDSIIQVLTLLLMTVSTATMILASIPQLRVSQESASRVLRLANLSTKSFEHEGRSQIRSVGDISFSDVQFRYPSRPDHFVLKNMNLQIPTGACVALVGRSGSGKSSVASILLKLYQTSASRTDPSSDDVTLSNCGLHQASTTTVRNLISVVSQTPTLFPTSISGNIVYGLRANDLRNSAANVRAAATSAGIHEFVASLPEGYDTLIGDGGMGLSGGQAQRIAIARALARQPEVLIMDEATSALDLGSAGVIRQTVQRLLFESRLPGAKPLTVVIITHSKDMMEICDKIIMLDQGRVVEEGAYDELIARDGRFARLLRGEA
jgi:ATP-binding cassette subfamily B (MDR/TAP) protein 1